MENLLLQQNGENMLLQGLCVYNYNHICEVLQIKTLTTGMTAALHRPSAENNVSEEIITTIMDQPRPQGAFPCKAREKRPGDEVDNGQFNRETTTMGKKKRINYSYYWEKGKTFHWVVA